MKKSLITLGVLGLLTQSAAYADCPVGMACPCEIQPACPTCVQCPTIPNPLQKVCIPRCPCPCQPACPCPTCQPKSPCPCPTCAPKCPCPSGCACPCQTGCACPCPSCASLSKFKTQYVTGGAAGITAAPLKPSCEAVMGANARIEKVTIKGKRWYNRDRVGYRAVLTGDICDQCTGCATPIQAKGLILRPKKYFWEEDKYIVE